MKEIPHNFKSLEICPVPAEAQAELVQTLQWLIPEEHIFADYIRDKNNREKLIQKVESLKNLPEKPEKINPEIEAERVSSKEMDQTTFRDLCRLWETFMRLHKVCKKPLTLLIMLHQEERALDAARATGGIVNVLGWSKDQHLETLSKVKVLGQGFHPLHPEAVLSQKSNTY